MKAIASEIQHPLQSKVDLILKSRLGEQKEWKIGRVVGIDDFNSIRNKAYVKSYLAKIGFIVGSNCMRYVYSPGLKPEHKAAQVKPEKPQVTRSKSEEYGYRLRQRKEFKTKPRKCKKLDFIAEEVRKVAPKVRGLLRHLLVFGEVCNGGYDYKERQYISTSMSQLRKHGYEIKSSRKWSDKHGTNVMTYTLKNPKQCVVA